MSEECKKCIFREKKNKDWICREHVKFTPLFDFIYLKSKTFEGCKFFKMK
jgi:hypothetical protein